MRARIRGVSIGHHDIGSGRVVQKAHHLAHCADENYEFGCGQGAHRGGEPRVCCAGPDCFPQPRVRRKVKRHVVRHRRSSRDHCGASEVPVAFGRHVQRRRCPPVAPVGEQPAGTQDAFEVAHVGDVVNALFSHARRPLRRACRTAAAGRRPFSDCASYGACGRIRLGQNLGAAQVAAAELKSVDAFGHN